MSGHETDLVLESVSASVSLRPRIVLAASASTAGYAALNVAVDIAVRRELPLHLVRVWNDVDWLLSGPPSQPDARAVEERTEQEMFAKICADARDRAPHLQVSSEFIPGDVYSSLLERTVGAELLVLGTRATHGVELGRLSAWFMEHACCPVIVVDPAERIVEYRACSPMAHAAR